MAHSTSWHPQGQELGADISIMDTTGKPSAFPTEFSGRILAPSQLSGPTLQQSIGGTHRLTEISPHVLKG